MRTLVTTLVACLVVASASTASAANALAVVNLQRSYRGLPALLPDPQLQAAAERACATRASRGRSGHLGGGPVAGHWEGVGWQSRSDRWGVYFMSCYQAHRTARYAGAAYVVTPRGTFYQLNLR